MTLILDWLSGPTAESLCLAFLHSLWQGAAWYAWLLFLLRRIPGDRPQARYAMSLTCLYGLLVGACVTWSVLRQPATPADVPAPSLASVVDTGRSPEIEAVSPPISRRESMAAPEDLAEASPTHTLAIASLAPWIVAVWMVGASVCLLLSSRHVAAVRRFRSGMPIDDPQTLQVLQKLVSSFNLSRPVQLLSVDGLVVPGVVGTLKPVILIPSSLLSGLTPDQWEAILAHELAHIRRWDYLVNLSQLIIESLLFFNPAVWCLSRQVRLEREACCDAAAVQVTAQPFLYAKLLVEFAERVQLTSGRGLAPNVAFSRASDSSLLERVRRIITPHQRTELTVRRPLALSFLIVGLFAVVLLQAGSDVAVTVAARMWNDEERVAKLSETSRQLNGESGERLTIRGTIEFEGEKPAQQLVTIDSKTIRGNCTINALLSKIDLSETSVFEETVGPGVVYLAFSHPDFMDTRFGPYGANDVPMVDGVRVVLERGIDVPVEIVDENGIPVAGAQIRATPEDGSTRRKAPNTNEDGLAVLEHINPDLVYNLWVVAPGFQETHQFHQKLASDTLVRCSMSHAQPATGIVVDHHGNPVANATIKDVHKRRPGSEDNGGLYQKPLATTDDEGRFALTELASGWTYDLAVESANHAPAYFTGVEPGDEDVRIELGPPIAVAGIVRGPIEQFKTLTGRKPILWRLHLRSQTGDEHSGYGVYGRVGMELVDGIGHFKLPPMAPGEMRIEIGDAIVKRKLTTSIDDLEIDLGKDARHTQPSTRKVQIFFTRDGTRVSPGGTVQIDGRRSGEFRNEQRTYPIDGGKVEAELFVPDHLHFDSRGMIGFWFNPYSHTTEIVEGEGPLEIEIPVRQAGAVKGVVCNADGTTASNASASVIFSLAYPTPTGETSFGGGASSHTNDKGEFFISPIPFDAECSIRASQQKNIALAGEFTVNAKNALPSFSIKLGRAVDAVLRVVDPAGTPLAGLSVALECRHPQAPISWGPPEITNRQGEVQFSQLSPELEGYYEVTLDCTRDYVPIVTQLKVNGDRTTIRLVRGKVIEGTLLNSQNSPVAGVRLQAKPVSWNAGELLRQYEPEARTDSQGRFRFSNLPDTEMIVCVENWPDCRERVVPAEDHKVTPILLRTPD